MKSLFIVTITFGVFTASAISAKAQTNVNAEKFDDGAKQNANSKYIVDKDTEFVTEGIASTKSNKIAKSNQPISPTPAFLKAGYVSNIELCTALQFKYAMLMDIEVESITNLPLYKFIDEWWGTSYQYGGADHSGIDCSSFTSKLLSDVYGLSAPRTAKDQYIKCEKITMENLEEGNLVFFNTSGGVSHVGLYLGNNYFVHSSLNSGVTISSLKEEYYSRKFISGGKILMPATPLASNR